MQEGQISTQDTKIVTFITTERKVAQDVQRKTRPQNMRCLGHEVVICLRSLNGVTHAQPASAFFAQAELTQTSETSHLH